VFQCCHVLLLHQPCFKFDDERSILLVNHSSSSHLSQNRVVLIFILTCIPGLQSRSYSLSFSPQYLQYLIFSVCIPVLNLFQRWNALHSIQTIFWMPLPNSMSSSLFTNCIYLKRVVVAYCCTASVQRPNFSLFWLFTLSLSSHLMWMSTARAFGITHQAGDVVFHILWLQMPRTTLSYPGAPTQQHPPFRRLYGV
jgi:hypothetical protein